MPKKIWVPALTYSRINMQRIDYAKDCSDQQKHFIPGNKLWGPRNLLQNNWWDKCRKINRPRRDSFGPTEGLWCFSWVKNMGGDGTLSNINWP